MDKTVFTYASGDDGMMRQCLIRSIEVLTGRRHLERLYTEYRSAPAPRLEFFDEAVSKLDLTLSLDQSALSAIPRTGSVVLVANHPFGVLDGIVMCHLISQIRSDFRVLANSVLWKAEEMRNCLLPIDFSVTKEALRTNIRSRQDARRFLEQGGVVVVFPAGAVSTTPSFFARKALDQRWGTFTAQLVHRAKAPVVPLYFEGQNSQLFQWASHLHETFRLSLLFREVKERIGTRMGVRVGQLLPYEELATWGEAQNMMDRLRAHTYELAGTRDAY